MKISQKVLFQNEAYKKGREGLGDMDRVFSADEIADQYWSPHPSIHLGDDHEEETDQPSFSTGTTARSKLMGMNRSASEWAFQRFLQEAAMPDRTGTTLQSSSSSSHPPKNVDVVEIKGNHHYGGVGVNGNQQQPEMAMAAVGVPLPNIPVDSEEYQAYLKSRLEMACAAVALTQASTGKGQVSPAAAPDNGSQASNKSRMGSHVAYKGSGQNSSKLQEKDIIGPVGVPPLPAISKKTGAQVKSTASGSSGELSDDDEAQGENESTQNTDPTDSKRMRRMLSNRESARRSRRRKQAHLTELETQVSEVRVENSSLLKRLTDISQKYNESAVDNRVLKADVETLRAKVKMAEETVKRVTGLNPFFQAMSEISTMSLPSFAGRPDIAVDAGVPVQDNLNQRYYHPPSNGQTSVQDHRNQNDVVDIPPVNNVVPNEAAGGAVNKVGRTVPVQRVASLEHLQKRICGASGSLGTADQ